MKTKLQLPAEVTSAQDLTALILEVRQYVKWFSHNAILQRVSKKREAKPIELSPNTKKLLQNWETQHPITTRSLDELVDVLNLYRNTAPTLSITLASPVTNDIKETLVKWCRENIAPNVMVSFGFNATLLGGMVIHSGSHIFDWSFRRQILANRQNFAEVLRRV